METSFLLDWEFWSVKKSFLRIRGEEQVWVFGQALENGKGFALWLWG